MKTWISLIKFTFSSPLLVKKLHDHIHIFSHRLCLGWVFHGWITNITNTLCLGSISRMSMVLNPLYPDLLLDKMKNGFKKSRILTCLICDPHMDFTMHNMIIYFDPPTPYPLIPLDGHVPCYIIW